MADPSEKDYEAALSLVLDWMSVVGYAGDMHSEDAAGDAQGLAGLIARALASAEERGRRKGLEEAAGVVKELSGTWRRDSKIRSGAEAGVSESRAHVLDVAESRIRSLIGGDK